MAADADKLIYDKYIELDRNVKNLVNYGVKLALPYIIEANEHVNLSSRCANNFFVLMSGIKMLKLSAIKCKFFLSQFAYIQMGGPSYKNSTALY